MVIEWYLSRIVGWITSTVVDGEGYTFEKVYKSKFVSGHIICLDLKGPIHLTDPRSGLILKKREDIEDCVKSLIPVGNDKPALMRTDDDAPILNVINAIVERAEE